MVRGIGQDLSVYTYTYMFMATKTISITKDAYEALLNEKRNSESFTQTILRLTQKKGKLADSFGKWKMTDQEEQAMRSELSEGWRLVGEKLSVEVP
jgi:predicted CopG family antitoxin